MDARTRVRNSILHETIDRVPAGLFGTARSYELGLTEHLGLKTIEDMYRHLGVDVWHTGGLTYCGGTLPFAGRWVDPVKELYWENNPQPPFSDISCIEQIQAYPFPDMDAFDETSLDQEIDSHADFAICSGINSAIFHNYLYMCGQETGLCYLLSEPELAQAIIGRITDFWVAYLDRVLTVANGRAVFVENCNDFGTQTTLFISPETFRTFFLPQLKRLYDKAHEYGVFCMQHSCGAVNPIIPDYIKAGADIINPIQITATGMDLSRLVEQYRKQITFYGGIDTQYLLPQGPIEQIQETVRQALDLFGNMGGFILSGSQGLMEDIPYANAVAMLDLSLRENSTI